MADYVIIPKADYKSACDAIRDKTQKGDPIKSGEMASEVASIGTVPKTTAIDYSNIDNGTFTETLDDGTQLTYTVESEDGTAVSVITPNGKVIPILWAYLINTMLLEGFSVASYSSTDYEATLDNDCAEAIFEAIAAVLPLDSPVVEMTVVFDGVRYKINVSHNSDMGDDQIDMWIDDSFMSFGVVKDDTGYGGWCRVEIEGSSHTFALMEA